MPSRLCSTYIIPGFDQFSLVLKLLEDNGFGYLLAAPNSAILATAGGFQNIALRFATESDRSLVTDTVAGKANCAEAIDDAIVCLRSDPHQPSIAQCCQYAKSARPDLYVIARTPQHVEVSISNHEPYWHFLCER
jgi:hypothetical protein